MKAENLNTIVEELIMISDTLSILSTACNGAESALTPEALSNAIEAQAAHLRRITAQL